MGKWFSVIKKRFGKGFTFLLVPNSYGSVKSFAIPLPIMIAILGIVLFNIYIFVGYIIQSVSIYQYHQKITDKDKYIAKLEQEQKEIKPTLKRSYEINEELNKLRRERAKLLATWKAIQQKSNRMPVSRGVMIRTSTYQLKAKELPGMLVTPLTELNSNLEQLDNYIKNETKEEQDLVKQLLAYERMLDHTPSKWPVSSRKITSWFGYREHPVYGRVKSHTGVDIKVGYGSKVHAASDGVVSFSGYRGGYGYTIIIDHGYGYQTLYAHNSELVAQVGMKVKKGDLICYSGNSGTSTGPHLHFEVLQNKVPVNPLMFLQN